MQEISKTYLLSIAIIAIVLSTAFSVLSDNGKAGYTGSQDELVIANSAKTQIKTNGNEKSDFTYNSSKVVTSASSTGILEQNKSISEFKAYINSEGQIAIEFQSANGDQPRINLYDMDGRMISSQLIEFHSIGKVKSSISIPDELKSGNYIVSILSSNSKLSSKIFIP